MNFTLPLPSLEHMALVKAAITLWSQGDVRDWTSKPFRVHKYIWEEVEGISKTASKLPLPPKFIDKLSVVIESVGLQMLSLKLFHTHHNSNDLPALVFWTPHGTIDKKKTAETMIKDETVDIVLRFDLACIYCIVKDIRDLWDKLDFNRRTCLTNKIYGYNLVQFWFEYLSNRDNFRLEKEFVNALYVAALDSNEIAARYFYHELKSQNIFNLRLERIIKKILMQLHNKISDISLERCSGTLWFLLSTICVEEQEAILKSYTYAVLRSLLVWPRQCLFLEMLKDKWNFLPIEHYHNLIQDIVKMMNYKHNHLTELFGKFWQQSPEIYKQFVIDAYDFESLFLKLDKIKDVKNTQLIIKGMSVPARKKLMFGDNGKTIFMYLIHREKWDSVKFLIQECLTSPEEITKFKDEFRNYVTELVPGGEFVEESPRDELYQLFEDCILESNKRQHTNDNNTSFKSHCCEDNRD